MKKKDKVAWLYEHLNAAITERLRTIRDTENGVSLRLDSVTEKDVAKASAKATDELAKHAKDK